MKHKKIRKATYIFLIVLLVTVIFCGLHCFIGFLLGPVKTAVFPWELKRPYIICQPTRTTGYEWIMTRNEAGLDCLEYCIITGADPASELGMKYPFNVTKNNYVFYVEDKQERYSQEEGTMVVEYTVSGWDILFPVRHGDQRDLLPISKHIFESDCTNQAAD